MPAAGTRIINWKAINRVVGAMKRHLSTLFVSVSLVINNMQLIDSFKESMSIPWPSTFNIFGPATGAANIQIFQIPSLACIAPDIKLYTYTESLALWAIIAITLLVLMCYAGLKYALRRGTYTRAKLVQYCRQNLALMLALLQIIYIPIAESILSLFLCEEINGVKYLKGDLSERCDTTQHKLWVAVGVFWFFLFPFGVPLLYFNVLIFYRVPYLAQLKFDIEYLRRLIDVMAREQDMSFVVHSRLTLDLDPTLTDLLWNRFMRDSEGEPLKVIQTKEGHFQILYHVNDDSDTHAAQSLTRQMAMRARRSFLALSLVQRLLQRYRNEVLGVVPPATENDFKIAALVQHAKDAGYAIEPRDWETKFESVRERNMEKVARKACGFLFEEYQAQAWYWELVEMSKDLSISSGLRFVRPGSSIQVFAGLLIVYYYMSTFLRVNPLVGKVTQMVGYITYVSLFGFFVLGSILVTQTSFTISSANDSKIKGIAALVLMLSIFVVPMSLACYAYYNNVRDDLMGKKTAEEDSDSDESDSDADSNLAGSDSAASSDEHARRRRRRSSDVEFAHTWADVFSPDHLQNEYAGHGNVDKKVAFAHVHEHATDRSADCGVDVYRYSSQQQLGGLVSAEVGASDVPVHPPGRRISHLQQLLASVRSMQERISTPRFSARVDSAEAVAVDFDSTWVSARLDTPSQHGSEDAAISHTSSNAEAAAAVVPDASDAGLTDLTTFEEAHEDDNEFEEAEAEKTEALSDEPVHPPP